MGFHDKKGFYHAFRAAILLSIFDFREVAESGGAVSNIAGNGGILASDTAPIGGVNASESQHISWATGNVDPIAVQISLPHDFDGTEDVLVEFWVNSGTTNAATMTIETGWDGGALVTDTATDSAPSATTHKITATIAAADIPDNAAFLTMQMRPGTHATDAIQLLAARISYVAKQTS
jgi:hypothetical protein